MPTTSTPDATPAAQLSVLIVEDDSIISSALRMLFERRGWKVYMASTIRQAKALLDQQPTWAILDLMLPDGDGSELIVEVRRRKLLTRVAIATGINDPDRIKTIQNLAPDAFLRKPVSFSHLLRSLGVDPDK